MHVTSDGVASTPTSKAIEMNNYGACHSKDKTAHSSGQSESYNSAVGDKYIKVSSYEHAIVLSDLKFSISMKSSFPYSTLCP